MMAWEIYVDGASSGNPGDSGAGIYIRDGNGREVLQESISLGTMTNNMAEYEALVRGLHKAIEYAARDVIVYTDSQLVANQITGAYKIHNDRMRQYVLEVKKIVGNFDHFAIQYIPRERNRIADKLAKNGIQKG